MLGDQVIIAEVNITNCKYSINLSPTFFPCLWKVESPSPSGSKIPFTVVGNSLHVKGLSCRTGLDAQILKYTPCFKKIL